MEYSKVEGFRLIYMCTILLVVIYPTLLAGTYTCMYVCMSVCMYVFSRVTSYSVYVYSTSRVYRPLGGGEPACRAHYSRYIARFRNFV